MICSLHIVFRPAAVEGHGLCASPALQSRAVPLDPRHQAIPRPQSRLSAVAVRRQEAAIVDREAGVRFTHRQTLSPAPLTRPKRWGQSADADVFATLRRRGRLYGRLLRTRPQTRPPLPPGPGPTAHNQGFAFALGRALGGCAPAAWHPAYRFKTFV